MIKINRSYPKYMCRVFFIASIFIVCLFLFMEWLGVSLIEFKDRVNFAKKGWCAFFFIWMCTFLLRRFLVCWDDMTNLKDSIKSLSDSFKDSFAYIILSILTIVSSLILGNLCWEEGFVFFICFAAFVVLISVSFLCVDVVLKYDDAEMDSSQMNSISIGENWALSAYNAYFKPLFQDLQVRLEKFEKEKQLRLLTRKLVVICPLSCEVQGRLTKRDERIRYVGSVVKPDDQGANVNRQYRTPIYHMHMPDNDHYIAAEYPNALMTLYNSRDEMDPSVWKYHRDCFFKKLESLLEGCPCIVLKYDDRDRAVTKPLQEFLLSKLKDYLPDEPTKETDCV